MKKKLLVLLFSLASLALVACGGGNDVASSGASAVSAAVAPTPDANTAITQSTTTAAKQTNEPKVNGQVDERTGVAPVAAQMTVASWCSTYSNPAAGFINWNVCGCGQSSSFGGSGPALNMNQNLACNLAFSGAFSKAQCTSLGGGWVLANACCACIASTTNGQCQDMSCW